MKGFKMGDEKLYSRFAAYYDKIYRNVDYTGESEFIKFAAKKHKSSSGIDLLDMACGTGSHAEMLKDSFNITGIDINEDMLELARQKVPKVNFILGDMKDLKHEADFDVITCIFSAIHYNKNYSELERTLRNFYQHLNEGGILIYDLSLNTSNWIEGLVSVDTVVEDRLKLARICQSKLKDGIFNADFVFLIKDNGKFDFDIDSHELGVFKIKEVWKIMKTVGFETFIYADFTEEIWEDGEAKRPVFVGVKNQ